MPCRIAVRFAVTGDLRFLSHQDSMRLFERAAVRAGLPLRWGQGFNPRPRLSLPLPRPVGVASDDEMLVLELEGESAGGLSACGFAGPQAGDTPGGGQASCDPADALARLAGQTPPGIRLLSAERIAAPPHPRAAWYSVALGDAAPADLTDRLAGLLAADHAVVQRQVDAHGQRRPVDIRPFVETAQWDAASGRLTWTLRVTPGGSARPGELLAALGIDPRNWLHRVMREQVDWQCE